jgi:hypothetical protein
MAGGDLGPRPLRSSERDLRLFVDRDEELAAAEAALARGGNVLVLGPRGIGKTSFLHRLERLLESRGRRAALVPGRVAESLHDLLAVLRDRLEAADPAVRGRSQGPETAALLLDDLRLLREAIPAGEPTIVLLDETPSPSAARALFGRLRDELWELPLAWCVAADSADRADYLDPPADAFWTTAIELSPLDDERAAELLARRLDEGSLAAPELELIVGEARGNPRRLVSLAHDAVVGGVPPAEAAERSRRRAERANGLGTAARRLLADLEANGPASASDPGLLRRLAWSRGRAAQVFKQLEEAGLVSASDRRAGAARPQRVYELTAR